MDVFKFIHFSRKNFLVTIIIDLENLAKNILLRGTIVLSYLSKLIICFSEFYIIQFEDIRNKIRNPCTDENA